MSGHSKWANIKHKKAKVDAQRGNIFSKISRELMVAARAGGGNPDTNTRLRIAIQKAREANIPSENIQRAIQKGTGELEGINYEELVYEGYGPGGVAIMLDILTDNRNRTAGEIRHLFSKHGGNLGETGCVSWMFEKRGYIVVNKEGSPGEDDLMLIALEAGAEDLVSEGDTYEVFTKPEDLEAVRESLVASGVPVAQAEVTMLPKSTVSVAEKDVEKLLKLMDVLEEHDDVQNVYANFDLPEEVMQKHMS
ncbi:MAG: YebC/PmpR family DNA-binding transcriptional regulator [Bacillota bacterium]